MYISCFLIAFLWRILFSGILCTSKAILAKCWECLSSLQALSSEASVLQKLLYMKHGQLRNEKSYQGMKQVFSTFTIKIPSLFGFSCCSSMLYEWHYLTCSHFLWPCVEYVLTFLLTRFARDFPNKISRCSIHAFSSMFLRNILLEFW